MTLDDTSSKLKPILPPTYLLIALCIMLGLYVIYPAVKFIPTPWNLLGLLLLGFGIWISYAAEAQFHRVKTTVQPYDEPTTLVTDGAFVLSRNPMYLGFASILMGVAILLRSLTPFLVIPVFVALINVKFIRSEEGMMAKTFDQDWRDYVKKTRRWI
jgi:protein-S-isoprenylcysteine O-methyltransferase Ste14